MRVFNRLIHEVSWAIPNNLCLSISFMTRHMKREGFTKSSQWEKEVKHWIKDRHIMYEKPLNDDF